MNNFDSRRFGGLTRLYGLKGIERLQAAHVVVVGLGGVGSWAAEALARSGIGELTLIDLDHITESNINRQIHALTQTLGQSKISAMADRIRSIHPDCKLRLIDDFISPENVSHWLNAAYTVIIDCTDQIPAKAAMTVHARKQAIPLISCGGAGGKTDCLSLRAGDLSIAVNDALLAKLRSVLRRQWGFPKVSYLAGKSSKRLPKMGVWALWFDQVAIFPKTALNDAASSLAKASPLNPKLQGLSCAGYGSVVTVTATLGLAAANEAIRLIVA